MDAVESSGVVVYLLPHTIHFSDLTCASGNRLQLFHVSQPKSFEAWQLLPRQLCSASLRTDLGRLLLSEWAGLPIGDCERSPLSPFASRHTGTFSTLCRTAKYIWHLRCKCRRNLQSARRSGD